MTFRIENTPGGKLAKYEDINVGWILLTNENKFIAKLWKSDVEIKCKSDQEAEQVLEKIAFILNLGYTVTSAELLEDGTLDVHLLYPSPVYQINVNIVIGDK